MISEVAKLSNSRLGAGGEQQYFADELPVALVEVGPGGIIASGNLAARQLTGHDVRGLALAELVHPDDHGLLGALGGEMAFTGEAHLELRVLNVDAGYRWVRSHARVILDDDGAFVKAVATWTDITDQVVAREASARFGELLEAVEDVVAIADLDGRLLHLNLAGRIMLEDETAPLDGIYLSDLFTPESAEEINEVALSTVRHFGSWKGEVMIMPPDFEPRVVSLSLVSHSDDAGNETYLSAMTRDITDLKAAEDALRRQATTDALTGLPNRAILFDRLGHALARSARSGGGVALLFIDLDKFKAVNDRLGHEAGDELLIQVSQRLLGSVRECDTVGRLGGDEFVVLAEPIIRFEDASVVADRIVRNLSEPFQLASGTAQIGASVGLAMSDRESTPRALLKKADTAVYRAKAEGRSQVIVAD